MGYLPIERFEVGFPTFSNVSLDLAAPVKVLARKPIKMVVGVKRLVLVCPSEEILQQLEGGTVDESDEKNLEDPEPVSEDEDTVVNKLVVSVVIESEEKILDVGSCGVLKAVDEEYMAVQSVELMKYSK